MTDRKTITLQQSGWNVSALVDVKFWGGGSSHLKGNEHFVPLGELTKERLLKCIDDGGFGVRKITQAVVVVRPVYTTGNGTITATGPGRRIEITAPERLAYASKGI